MKAKLQIGEGLALPADTVTSTLVFYGGKGMGKTNLGAVIVEELAAAGLRWAWLDPLGVSWGLRHSADGAGPGVECLILGGPHGDVPIQPDGGAAVADVVVEESVNVLVDFSRKPSGEMWGVGEKIRFVTDYTRQVFKRQGDLVGGRRREPLFQVLDEAARYVPQTVPAGNPQLALCVAAWQQLVEEGRNIGLGVGLITQRSARMNKDVSELADAMFAFRTVGPNSLEAVLDWLGAHVARDRVKEAAERVRSLERGQALVVSPGWLDFEGVVKVRLRHTFDSSATPKPGERARVARGEGAKPDLQAIRQRMQSSIERAASEDPKLLQRRLHELEAELAKARKAPPAPKAVEPKRVDVPVLSAKCRAALDRLSAKLDTSMDAALAVRDALAAVVKAATRPAPIVSACAAQEVPATTRKALTNIAGAAIEAIKLPPRREVVRTPVNLRIKNGEALPKGEREVLARLVQHGCLSREQLTTLTGYRKSTRNLYLQKLERRGYIEQTSNGLEPTREGCAALPEVGPLPTGAELREYWSGRLPEGERRILGVLIAAYPEHVDRDELSARTGYTKSTRNLYLQKLASRELVDAGRDGVRARATLFD